MTLVNKIIQVSGVQFYNTSSVYCVVCSPLMFLLNVTLLDTHFFWHQKEVLRVCVRGCGVCVCVRQNIADLRDIVVM